MKSWKILVGTVWRGGRSNVASGASVRGSNMYSRGPPSPTQIDTTRPRRSNVIEPQSPIGLSIDENVRGERPSGPPRV